MRRTLAFLAVLMFIGPLSIRAEERSEPAASQDLAKGHSLVLNLSLRYLETRESLIRGQTYSGAPFGLEFGYEFWGNSRHRSIGLALNLGGLNDRFDFVAHRLSYDLSWSEEKQIASFAGGKAAFFLGGGLLAGSDFYFYDNMDESHGYWLTTYALNLRSTLSARLTPGSLLSLEFSAPVLAFLSRPPARRTYKTDVTKFSYILEKLNENLRLVTVNNLLSLNLNLKYRLRLGSRLTGLFSLGLSSLYCRLPEGKSLRNADCSLAAGLIYGLGRRDVS